MIVVRNFLRDWLHQSMFCLNSTFKSYKVQVIVGRWPECNVETWCQSGGHSQIQFVLIVHDLKVAVLVGCTL